MIRMFGNSFYYNNILFVYTKVGDQNKWETLDRSWKIWGCFGTDRVEDDLGVAFYDLIQKKVR